MLYAFNALDLIFVFFYVNIVLSKWILIGFYMIKLINCSKKLALDTFRIDSAQFI